MGEAADVFALVGEIDRPELGMRLQEEAVGGEGGPEEAGEDRVVGPGGDAGGVVPDPGVARRAGRFDSGISITFVHSRRPYF